MSRTLAVWFAVVIVVGSLGGCSWFGWFRKPAAAPTTFAPPTYPDAQPESAARAACADYEAVFAKAEYPREAIIRGLDSGRATVWFQVDGTRLDILSVKSSDTAFGDAAAETIGKLGCRTTQRTTFVVPFAWRSAR